MDNIDWNMIKAIAGLLAMQGGLFLAAAKSIFITKKMLYDRHGITNFVTRLECDSRKVGCERHKDELERRKDAATRAMCFKIDNLKKEMDQKHNEVINMRQDFNKELNELIRKLDVYIAGQQCRGNTVDPV